MRLAVNARTRRTRPLARISITLVRVNLSVHIHLFYGKASTGADAKSLKRKVIPSETTSAQELHRPKPPVQCQRDVLGVYQHWRLRPRHYAALRPPPPSANPLRHTLPSLASARSGSTQSRGAVEHLRVEAHLLAAQLVIPGARSVPVGKPSTDELRCALAREREEGEIRKETRAGALRAELTGAVGSGKTRTTEGGSEGAQVFRVAEELRGKGNTCATQRQFLEIVSRNTRANHGRAETQRAGAQARDPPPPADAPHHTTVSDARTPALTGPAQVQDPRRVAATFMNARTQCPRCASAGRTAVVDERRSHRCSRAHERAHTGRRARERGGAAAQRINRNPSLRALGDVVAALARMSRCLVGRLRVPRCASAGHTLRIHAPHAHAGALNLVDLAGSARRLGARPGAHVPYRKLDTKVYLRFRFLSSSIPAFDARGADIPLIDDRLQMVLNLSPLAAHLNASLTSLRFATKVSCAQIGTANKVQIPSAGVLNPGNPGTLVLVDRKMQDRDG
ncbi:hypothetical protein FB451DRAFT_1568459 [Mycena latifolia]|nr:hypothetical protein FB451DRAFT_1568459 [Mycena latifolia]